MNWRKQEMETVNSCGVSQITQRVGNSKTTCLANLGSKFFCEYTVIHQPILIFDKVPLMRKVRQPLKKV